MNEAARADGAQGFGQLLGAKVALELVAGDEVVGVLGKLCICGLDIISELHKLEERLCEVAQHGDVS